MSFFPIGIHRVKDNRFVYLHVDLEHSVNHLVDLFKAEISRIKAENYGRSRKRLDKTEAYLRSWDLAKQEKTLSEIAMEIYPKDWRQIPEVVIESISLEPTPTEIQERAKELRSKGQCAYSWSFKQAREDLNEELIKAHTRTQGQEKASLRNSLRVRATVRQRVWRNIQVAQKLISSIAPMPSALKS